MFRDEVYRVCTVACGGALGTLLRFYVDLWISATVSFALPIGLLVINGTGCFAIGCLQAFLNKQEKVYATYIRLFCITGFLGGYTTFSTFVLITAQLSAWNKPLAVVYLLFQPLSAFFAVWLGMVFMKKIQYNEPAV